jgi:hypothetical protein
MPAATHKESGDMSPHSIRQLLILTFAVACLATLGRWLGPGLIPATDPFILVLAGLVLGAIGLVCVWSVLGTRNPILPSMIMTAITAGLGFSLAKLYGPSFLDMMAFWITITSVEALSLVATLLVVRARGDWCGCQRAAWRRRTEAPERTHPSFLGEIPRGPLASVNPVRQKWPLQPVHVATKAPESCHERQCLNSRSKLQCGGRSHS